MTLAGLQREFMGHVLVEDYPLPASWASAMASGLDVYRNAYRTRLVQALRDTFPRTETWIGEEPFRKAAAHYLISEPPTGWTLDGIGDGFVPVLETLFAGDRAVADLAWLEWAMHSAFTAPDDAPLTLSQFAQVTSGFGEPEWSALRLRFVAGLHMREVESDCALLWRALEDGRPAAAPAAEEGARCLVWREGWSPVFRITAVQEGRCLEQMRQGATFESLCIALMELEAAEGAAATAGAMLRRWLELGLIAAIRG